MKLTYLIRGSNYVAIYDDALSPVLNGTDHTIKRASHVEPSPCGGWTADMSPVGGPVLTDDGKPFLTRSAALTAEIAWLRDKMRNGELTNV